jgi:hypothetical protein
MHGCIHLDMGPHGRDATLNRLLDELVTTGERILRVRRKALLSLGCLLQSLFKITVGETSSNTTLLI